MDRTEAFDALASPAPQAEVDAFLSSIDAADLSTSERRFAVALVDAVEAAQEHLEQRLEGGEFCEWAATFVLSSVELLNRLHGIVPWEDEAGDD